MTMKACINVIVIRDTKAKMSEIRCGEHQECKLTGTEYTCVCEKGYTSEMTWIRDVGRTILRCS